MSVLPGFLARRPGGPYSCVVADPPWKHGDQLPGKKRGAGKHYDVMSTADICSLSLPDFARDSHLFLWRVASMQQEALDVVHHWGFTVKSELVWLKRTKTGKRHFGMGRHVRAEHEVCLICTRGRGMGILNKSIRSTFTTELYLDDDGGGSFEAAVADHSRKPPEFYEIVRSLNPGLTEASRVELFAREPRDGFTVIGNQVAGNPQTLLAEQGASEPG